MNSFFSSEHINIRDAASTWAKKISFETLGFTEDVKLINKRANLIANT